MLSIIIDNKYTLFGEEIIIDKQINEISIKIANDTDIYSNSIKLENKPNLKINNNKDDFFTNIKNSLRQSQTKQSYEYTIVIMNNGDMQLTIKQIVSPVAKLTILKEFILIKGSKNDFSLLLKSISKNHNDLIENIIVNERDMKLLLDENNKLRSDCNNKIFEKNEILQDLLLNMISILNTKKLLIRNLKERLSHNTNDDDDDDDDNNNNNENYDTDEEEMKKLNNKKRKNEIVEDKNQTSKINSPTKKPILSLNKHIVDSNSILNHLTQQQTQCADTYQEEDSSQEQSLKRQKSLSSSSSSQKIISQNHTCQSQTNSQRKKQSIFVDTSSDSNSDCDSISGSF